MSSSLTTCSSTAEDEFSSDVFGQGGNEVNDGGTTSVSDGNSRKTAIDGGMKRKMTELFILTVVNITVTVALISFIAPIENGRINAELESLKKFVGKMEQQHGNNAGEQKLSQFQNDQKKLLEKISEMERQSKVSGDELSKSQNDQKKILERIFSELENQTKKKVFLKFQQNCWDAFACHEDIQISDDKSLIVHYKGNDRVWPSVFAKYPIVLNKHLSDFFYYEISVMKEKHWVIFGFAVKQQTKLDGIIRCEKGTYSYDNYGYLCINGGIKGRNAEYSYGIGDTVGIGVNSATRQIIFTKNGLRLDTSDFFVDPSFADGYLYPFVSLYYSGDKIEANFGPNFKFDLATL